jgi:hypothetical protein
MQLDNHTNAYTIVNASPDDINTIYDLFEAAIQFQKNNQYIGWNQYDTHRIQEDVNNGLLFKVTEQDNILCIFSICYDDRLIWREREKGDAMYVHRIVVNQVFKKQKMFPIILDWVTAFALKNNLKFIRMDTWADNEKLIGYYKSHGFAYIETYTTPDTTALPVQHRNLTVALLEWRIR